MLTDREKKVLTAVRKLFQHEVEINIHGSATRASFNNDVISVCFLSTITEYNDLRHELGLSQKERPTL